ncbi:hypothetical protein B9Z55_002695 [Caenorhabditis nigoni]|uniref:Uncharacterized protein n=1 Tax=Caenorhabditis nigoni TaxID=1611254 RepID=A0A2G5VLQ8_9PELO|nr:hypothetical protein B9Z55_002695 [Caenorhabditis nigoni]
MEVEEEKNPADEEKKKQRKRRSVEKKEKEEDDKEKKSEPKEVKKKKNKVRETSEEPPAKVARVEEEEGIETSKPDAIRDTVEDFVDVDAVSPNPEKIDQGKSIDFIWKTYQRHRTVLLFLLTREKTFEEHWRKHSIIGIDTKTGAVELTYRPVIDTTLDKSETDWLPPKVRSY